jgi:hypothetical protein
MIKWLGENRGELVGIKRYLSLQNKVSFLPNLQVSRGDFFVGIRILCTLWHFTFKSQKIFNFLL